YGDTVWVIVDSLKDVVGNWAGRDSFYFITQKRENAFIDFIRTIPDSAYIGDSVLVLAQVSSAFVIRGGMFYLDGSPYDYVYVKTDNLSPGVHSVSVEAYNDYTTSSKASTNFKVLNKPPLLDPKNVLVIPNPVKGSGKIKIFIGDDGTGGNVKVKIEVFNIRAARVLGKEITTQKLNTVEIPLPDLPPDIYVLRVVVNNKKVEKWFGVIR
ncbi:MAG: T9SS type A sorting domain-containing protein, partial [candidate division WOR-3 bacterium]